MGDVDTNWFTDTLSAKRLSQRGLARLLGCNASSVNRLIHGRRPLRFDEAERLAKFLGVGVSDVISRAGVRVASEGKKSRLVGFIDGSGEAHIDWNATGEFVPTLPDISDTAVAVQYRTAMTSRESMDGWTVYLEPPDEHIDRAINRFSLVRLQTGIIVIGFLRRGYKHGSYNISNFMGPALDNVAVSWASPVLLLRP